MIILLAVSVRTGEGYVWVSAVAVQIACCENFIGYSWKIFETFYYILCKPAIIIKEILYMEKCNIGKYSQSVKWYV